MGQKISIQNINVFQYLVCLGSLHSFITMIEQCAFCQDSKLGGCWYPNMQAFSSIESIYDVTDVWSKEYGHIYDTTNLHACHLVKLAVFSSFLLVAWDSKLGGCCYPNLHTSSCIEPICDLTDVRFQQKGRISDSTNIHACHLVKLAVFSSFQQFSTCRMGFEARRLLLSQLAHK